MQIIVSLIHLRQNKKAVNEQLFKTEHIIVIKIFHPFVFLPEDPLKTRKSVCFIKDAAIRFSSFWLQRVYLLQGWLLNLSTPSLQLWLLY